MCLILRCQGNWQWTRAMDSSCWKKIYGWNCLVLTIKSNEGGPTFRQKSNAKDKKQSAPWPHANICQKYWLVVKKQSWKIWVRQWEGLSHIWNRKIKNVPNHQPAYIYIYMPSGDLRKWQWKSSHLVFFVMSVMCKCINQSQWPMVTISQAIFVRWSHWGVAKKKSESERLDIDDLGGTKKVANGKEFGHTMVNLCYTRSKTCLAGWVDISR